MTKIRNVAVLTACLLTASAAHAQLGGLGGMLGAKNTAGSADISADINAFVSQSNALREMTSRSVIAINAAFKSAGDSEASRAAFAAANALTNAKEKHAKLNELYESNAAELERLVKSGEAKELMGKLDAAKKKQIGDALMNFGIGSLQAVVLTKTGQSLLQKAGSNPMNVTKMMPVKDSLPVLGRVVSDAGGFMVGVGKLAKGANIEVPAVKVDSKPVEVSFS
ncbi:MAG TPA: hypothetical protein VGD30_08875 [Telluria sp.]